MKTIITLLFAALSLNVVAQGISGTVLDENKEPLPCAVVMVFKNGTLMGGNATDYDGNYVVRPLGTGSYTVVVRYPGYDSITITEVPVIPGYLTRQNFGLSRNSGHIDNCKARYIKPAIDGYFNIPEHQGADLSCIPSNFYQRVRGCDVNFGGHGIVYIVDGNPIPAVLVTGNNSGLESAEYWYRSPTDFVFTREDLSKLPTSDLRDAVSLLPGAYQARRGDDLNIFGARSQGTLYIVDGMRMR